MPAFGDEGWLGQITLLEEISSTAKRKVKELNGNIPWAINEMIRLYDRQIKLLYEIKKCLDGLKSSDIYLRENGIESENIYLDILKAINSMGKRFEALPRAYCDKNEEELRDHILTGIAPLPNINAFGEVYNKRG